MSPEQRQACQRQWLEESEANTGPWAHLTADEQARALTSMADAERGARISMMTPEQQGDLLSRVPPAEAAWCLKQMSSEAAYAATLCMEVTFERHF